MTRKKIGDSLSWPTCKGRVGQKKKEDKKGGHPTTSLGRTCWKGATSSPASSVYYLPLCCWIPPTTIALSLFGINSYAEIFFTFATGSPALPGIEAGSLTVFWMSMHCPPISAVAWALVHRGYRTIRLVQSQWRRMPSKVHCCGLNLSRCCNQRGH